MLLYLLLACPTTDIPPVRSLYPEVSIVPMELSYGDQTVPLAVSKTITISNAGKAILELSSLTVAGDDAFAVGIPSATIEKDESLDVEIVFQPSTYLDFAAELVVMSNDEDNPELRIPLSGRGTAGPLPDLEISERTVDFGAVVGTAQALVPLKNVGTANLDIGQVRLEGSGHFTLLTDPTGVVIGPGDSWPALVTYAPADLAGDSGTLVVPSNDPVEPEVSVLLLGNGGADYEYPIARINCPSQTDPPRFVALDGYASEDPMGFLPLTYAWTLQAVPTDPLGNPISGAYLSSYTGPATNMFADAVGTYEVDLVVTNDIGTRSAPARCFIEAIPDEQVVVELTWDTPNADLDVHLARSGAELFESPGDVSYCNSTPDWGVQGSTPDNPRLDLDDRVGFGPENINLFAPVGDNYTVRVHYFEDQGDSTVSATVRIYLAGSVTPAFQASRLMERDDVWNVAQINWPAATVGALSGALTHGGPRTCFSP